MIEALTYREFTFILGNLTVTDIHPQDIIKITQHCGIKFCKEKYHSQMIWKFTDGSFRRDFVVIF